MPPQTPSTTSVMNPPGGGTTKPAPRRVGTRAAPYGRSRVVGGLGREKAGVDLAHRDRERLLLRSGLDQRADVLEQALAELAVVGVDLTGALGREDHQRVLRRGLVEQLVDRRVGDAFGVRDGSHVVKSLMR